MALKQETAVTISARLGIRDAELLREIRDMLTENGDGREKSVADAIRLLCANHRIARDCKMIGWGEQLGNGEFFKEIY